MHIHSRIVISLLLVSTGSANALPERRLALEITTGVPQLASAAATFMIYRRVQIGFGFTYVPENEFIGQEIELEEQSVVLGDGNTYTVSPTVEPGAGMFAPFIRIFPADDNFYLHFSYPFIQATADIIGTFRNDSFPIPIFLGGALLTGNIRLRQFLPTAGVGYIWSSKRLFIGVSLGATFFGELNVASNVEVILPDEVGGLIGNLEQIEDLNETLSRELRTLSSEALADLRSQFPVIPSLQLSFGFFF